MRRTGGTAIGAWGLGIGLGLLVSGCDNPCQSLCVNLADYGDECGAPWTDGDIDACVDDQSNPSADDARTCRDYGTPERLRREWTCDDVTLYRDVGASAE